MFPRLWSIAAIGEYCDFDQRTVRSIVAKPDFPPPVYPTGPGGHPRWFEEEVREWFLAQRSAPLRQEKAA